MNTDTIITLSFKLFDEATSSKFDADNRVLALQLFNKAYYEVCRDSRCSRTTGTITTASGTREYAYPSGFVSLQQARYLTTILKPIFIHNIVPARGNSTPENYYLEGSIIGIEPIPAGTYTIDLVYFQGPTSDLTLSDTPSLIPAQWHYLLAWNLTYQFFVIDKGDQSQGAVKWKGLYEAELNKFTTYLKTGVNAGMLPDM